MMGHGMMPGFPLMGMAVMLMLVALVMAGFVWLVDAAVKSSGGTARYVTAGPGATAQEGKNVAFQGAELSASQQELSLLEIQRQRLFEQAAEAEKYAQLAAPDDEKVRAYLEMKQGALFRAQSIEAQIASLQQNPRLRS